MAKKLIYIALSIPIFIFLLPMLLSGNTLFSGDFDMQIQMSEAARLSIVKFHQFPFWNPWVSGGVPLFADPQFGLFTPQTVLTLFIGSIMAWKITVLIYFLIGFYSLHLLMRYIARYKDDSLVFIIISLLSYIWIFGSFFSLRAIGGHFTFMLLALLPLAIYLFLRSVISVKYFILLVLLLGYCINAALHYSTILILLSLLFVATMLSIYQLFSQKQYNIKRIVYVFKPIYISISAIILAIFFNSYRVYLSLEYLNDNGPNRSSSYEPFIGIKDSIFSIANPFGSYSSNPDMAFNQFEASNYIGTITIFIFAILFVMLVYKIILHKKLNIFYRRDLITYSALAITSFVLAIGGPIYYIARHFPIFSSMRVSTRFFFITSFSIIILILLLTLTLRRGSTKKQNKYLYLLVASLMLAAIQVFYYTYKFQLSSWTNNKYLISVESDNNAGIPKSEKLWNTNIKSHYYALTDATNNDIVQLIADNALVDTRIVNTNRCDEDNIGCSFIISNNAQVVSWSPNNIVLRRTSSGPILLNMNPGSHWKINNNYPFKLMKTVDTSEYFTINEDNDTYIIKYFPLPNVVK
jgi:hypothetical protein